MIKTLTRLLIVVGLALALDWAAMAGQRAELMPWRVLKGSHFFVASISFSRDSTMLADVNDDRIALVWHVRAGRVLQTIHEKSAIHAVAFSPASEVLAVGSDETLKLWDARTGKLVRAFSAEASGKGVSSLAFSPDGRLLAVGSLYRPGDEGLAWLWDIQTGTLRRTFGERATSTETRVDFSPDGRVIAICLRGSEDGITLWDVESGQFVRHLWGPFSVSVLAYSPDGHVIAGWGGYAHGGVAQSAVTLWDLQTGATSDVPVTNPLWALAFAPHGQVLAVTEHQDGVSADRVRLWDVRAKQWVASLSVPPKPPGYRELHALSFSPDGHLLAGVTFDGIMLWDVKNLLR